MGEFFISYGLFLAKILTFFLLFLLAVVLVTSLSGRGRREEGSISVTHINGQLDEGRDILQSMILDPADQKESIKLKKKQLKLENKEKKAAAKLAAKSRGDGTTIVDEKKRRRVFLLDFDGDIRATQVRGLRREITAVLTLADVYDEVLVRVESGGGTVHGYGLAASQLQRIRDKNIELTVSVDKVAASGGYLMACVANKILAAPFAIIGSIGVMAQIPNIHRLLKKYDVDVELLTAGEYKRTLTVVGENTEKGRQKFLSDLEVIHDQFKNFISKFRPQTNIAEVATGEVWSGDAALGMKLVDEIKTSDQYITECCEQADVYRVKYEAKKTLQEKIGLSAEATIDRVIDRWVQRVVNARFLS
ncbi:protease SohB [Chromatiales bacterium (ex Bugula neritina AB1)]|nr:protease SohB [Chromatiales bacterium (ex Bugula neritina AB1)]